MTEPDLTDVQKAYNVASSEMFQLAAYGHHRYHPSGESLTDKGRKEERDYNNRLFKAREDLEASLLRLIAEHAETFRGTRMVSVDWLRTLADDPGELSLLAVRPDEREEEAQPLTWVDGMPTCPSCGAQRIIMRLWHLPWRRNTWWRCYGCFHKFQTVEPK